MIQRKPIAWRVFLIGFVIGWVLVGAAMMGAALAGPLEDADTAERRDDYATAIPIYRLLAAKGDVHALKRLGFFFEIGVGVKRDWLEAANWYSKAADAGDAGAPASLSHLGRNWRFMYQNTSDETVYELIKRAAQKGYPRCAV
jgi:TPR repeat protein